MAAIKYKDPSTNLWEEVGEIIRGKDAAYVGSSAPTDPQYTIWVDTSETGEGLVTSVNGQVGAVTLDTVHVGSSSPTDPNIDIWLDTDEPGQTVVTSVNEMSGPVVLFESGTDGTWSWKKWSDGLLELQQFYNGPPATGTHYTTVNNFYGYYVSGFTFPSNAQPIDAYYSVMADWAIGSGFSIFGGTVSSKSTSGFSLYALSTASGQSVVRIGIYVRAKWK